MHFAKRGHGLQHVVEHDFFRPDGTARQAFDFFDRASMLRRHKLPHVGQVIGKRGGAMRNLHESDQDAA